MVCLGSALPGDVSSLGLPFKLPEETPHDLWEETKKDKASVWFFGYSMGPSNLVQHYS